MGNPKGVKRDFEALERRRMKALRLFGEGLSDAEIARRLKVSRHSVGTWRKKFAKLGRTSLLAAGRAGRQRKLTAAQDRAIVAALKAGASASGYSSDMWTLPRVAKLIEKIAGVKYHPGYVGEILKRLGWSCQRPAVRAKERNEAAIANWKRKVWPRIKKKPGESGAQ
jgi:transposase